MERAYSQFIVKSVDEEQRIIEGIATTPTLDREGDIIESLGVEFSLPMPLFWRHDEDRPVGEVIWAEATEKGIPFRAQIARIDEPGKLKENVDYAWHAVKAKLVRGVSIRGIPRDVAPLDTGRHVKKWLWLDLSLVPVPGNQEATIAVIKSCDTDTFTVGELPGATGTVKSVKLSQPKAREKMTYAEQIQALENTRAAKVARRDEIQNEVMKAARTKDEKEREEFDTLTLEIQNVDRELADARELEKSAKAAAVAIPAKVETIDKAAQLRAGTGGATQTISVRANIEKGISFARYVMALAACRGNRYEAAEFAKAHWGDQSGEIVQAIKAPIMKAAVAAGTTTDATWAAPLVNRTTLADEFLEMLRPATILGKLEDRFRRVPFNVGMPAQTGGGTYAWVGQGSAKPLTSAAFATVTLDFAKAAGIIVLSKELVKFSNPSAERAVRDEMIAGVGAFLDVQLTDPAVAAVANVSPASITNGVAGTVASGTTEAAARADIRALLGGFITGNFGLGGVVLIMNEGIAFTLGTVVNAVGEPAFPGLTATGGTLLGIPVITSNAVTAATGIIAVHAPSILYADDGGVEIDMSEEASLQMDSAPANPSDATTVMVSMWQRNLIALRAERFITWKVARAGAVRRIHTVAYA